MLTSMPRLIHILSILLFVLLASRVGAQTPSCGIVGIDGLSQVDAGTSLVLKAQLTGVTPGPELKWHVSAGTITMGQGTDRITVDTTGLAGFEIVVTVELSGAPSGCKGSASRTTRVILPGIICGLAFDSYGDIKFEDEKARLDNFAIQLLNEPLSIGLIRMSSGQKTFANESREHLDRAKSYLANVRGIDPNRITTLDCGFTTDLNIHLYIVLPGATPPECDRTVEVPFAQVKFTKPRPRSSKKRR